MPRSLDRHFAKRAIKSLLVVPKRAQCAVNEDIFLTSMADLSCNKATPIQSDPTVLLDTTCESEEQTTQKQLRIIPEQSHVPDLQTNVTDDNTDELGKTQQWT